MSSSTGSKGEQQQQQGQAAAALALGVVVEVEVGSIWGLVRASGRRVCTRQRVWRVCCRDAPAPGYPITTTANK
jgi:hypothetical protein